MTIISAMRRVRFNAAFRVAAALCCFVLAPPVSAAAETLKAGAPVSKMSKFAAYIAKGGASLGLRIAGADMDRRIGFDCDYAKDAKNLKLAIRAIEIQQDVVLPDNAEHPEKGIWSIRYRFTRCGETVVYNTVFRGRDGKPPRMLNLFPGHSSLHPKVMGLAGHEVLARARRDHLKRDCNDFDVVDTAAPTDDNGSGKVVEVWRVMACGKMIDYIVTATAKSKDFDDVDISVERKGGPVKP